MKKILVVDDEQNIRLLYEAELRREGYDVRVASSAKEALEWLEKENFDLMTLDIKMPGLDGLKFLEKIRKDYLDLPVIICTAYQIYREDTASWQGDDYVVKSSDLSELKEKIKYFLKE